MKAFRCRDRLKSPKRKGKFVTKAQEATAMSQVSYVIVQKDGALPYQVYTADRKLLVGSYPTLERAMAEWPQAAYKSPI